jgi:hypothetical protein
MLTTLPSGRLGRAVALGATLLIVMVVWFTTVQPLRDWYADGDALLNSRQRLAARMVALAEQVPALSRRAAALGGTGAPSSSILTGDTDAIAGAKLQETVQALAGAEGITPTSIENLPAVMVGHYRRIALHLSLVGRFPVLVRLLQAIGQATPRMLVDDLHVEGAHLMNQPIDAALEAQLTIIAFRSAGPVDPTPTPGSGR